jgi:DNA-binding NarL/FixJ family response regulator
MSSSIDEVNLRVVVLDTDFFALQSLNGYLAWDRRTRVMFLAESPTELWHYLAELPAVEQPDVLLMDADHLGGTEGLRKTIAKARHYNAEIMLVCMAQVVDSELIRTAADEGVRAYLLKQEVRMQIAAAIVYGLTHELVVTHSIARVAPHLANLRLARAAILPDQRQYPEMTDRIRQAIELCVIEGMPAHLAAHEMGISLHTIRGYIKEGYRILESYDQSEYPSDMTPQERAFMRFTALDDDINPGFTGR